VRTGHHQAARGGAAGVWDRYGVTNSLTSLSGNIALGMLYCGMPDDTKKCLNCARDLVRKPGEDATAAKRRNTCGHLCGGRYLAKMRTRPAHVRFWEHVEKLPDDGCWVWTGSRLQSGYGTFDKGRAHRFSYALANGPIPDGLHICHRCDNPPCVRPDHLFAGTRVDNMQDAIAKGRARHLRMTHCRQGHELTAENTVPRKTGYRQCRTCLRAYRKTSDAKRGSRNHHARRSA
jgi:hypothetical protein